MNYRYKLLKELLNELSLFSLNFRNEIFQTNIKLDKTPVTELDIINQYMCEKIIKYFFKNDKIIAEENLKDDFAIKTIKKYNNEILEIINKVLKIDIEDDQKIFTWFIDPIDGTKGFIDNLVFSIAISIVKNTDLISSGLACIGMNKVFENLSDIIIATTDNNKVEFNIKDIKIKHYPNSIAISRKHKTKKLYQELNKYGYKTIEIDSQAKYMLVLLKIVDFYIREAGSCGNKNDFSWDHLAGIHLIKTNKGCISDIKGEFPIFSDKSTYIIFNDYLISSSNSCENLIQKLKGIQ